MQEHNPRHQTNQEQHQDLGSLLFIASDMGYRTATDNIIEHVSFTIRKREVVTIIGPNGGGKTTVAKLILGLLQPTKGIARLEPGTRCGYMPQRLFLDPVFPMTVERLLSLHPRRSQALPKELQELVDEIDIASLLKKSLSTLSGGELQRVLLANALKNNPDLLVLDEPVQGLDIQGQNEFYQLLERIRCDHGCGILMISHDLHMVMASTNHVVCINRHMCCQGTPEHVKINPSYRALFGEAMAVYSHQHDHNH